MDKNSEYYIKHPLIIRAKELVEIFKSSKKFQSEESKTEILRECNYIINNLTGLNYGEICRPKNNCCG